MRRRRSRVLRSPVLLLLVLLAACADAAPAQTRDIEPPDGTRFAGSSQGTVYYAVTCDAWRRLSPRNLRFFATAADARAAGLRPSTHPGCGEADMAGDGVPMVPLGDGDTCTVARVVDGDTLACDGGTRIRLLLIDAPELSQGPWGEAAHRAMEALAPPGTPLRLELDVQPRDRYGRTLAYLWLDDERLLNEELLRAGVAVVAVYPPNVRHVDRLRAAQAEAREGKTGLWATSAFECSPGEHRAGRC